LSGTLRALLRAGIPFVVLLRGVGGVTLLSRTLRSVTLSSTEAEYVAMGDGVKEAISLRDLWSFIFPNGHVSCTVVYEDVSVRFTLPATRSPQTAIRIVHVPSHLFSMRTFSQSPSIGMLFVATAGLP